MVRRNARCCTFDRGTVSHDRTTVQRAVSLHRKFRPLHRGGSDLEQTWCRKIPRVQRRQPTEGTGTPGNHPALAKPRLRCVPFAFEIVERVCQSRRATARFRVHGLRQRRGGDLSGVARAADDGALGRARSRGGDRNAGRDRARLQGCLSHAGAAHRHFHVAAAAVARPFEPAKEDPRNRPAQRCHRESGRADVKSTLAQRIVAEGLGTAFLLAAVVGSGVMAARLSGGNGALALLCNTLPTGAILAVLILTFGPVSGAHFNPAVSIASALRGELPARAAAVYIAAQIAGAIAGVWAAHAMFDLPLWQISLTVRTGPGQWLAEGVATFGLLLTILGCAAQTPSALPYAVGLYITSAYWFTASTSFANPAVTIARARSDTYAGIAPAGIAAFIAAQVAGMVAAVLLAHWLWRS